MSTSIKTKKAGFLPYGRQLVEDDDIAAVTDVLRGDYLTTGPVPARFESTLCEVTGARYATVCSNGTAALHLAAMALGLGEGDAVIVPAITFLATANAARYCGAEVVFADVNAKTGLMEAAHLQEALTRIPEGLTPKAVFPVHMNGWMVDMRTLSDVAREHELAIVEDSCHALGAAYDYGSGMEGHAGDCRFSDMACFSFHPVKTIAMGEGGAVTTNNPELQERLQRLRNHGMTRDENSFSQPSEAFTSDGTANPWYYEMPEVGYNYRASDILCALGLSQLKKLTRFAAVRRILAAHYDKQLEALAPLINSVPQGEGCYPVLHLYAVHMDFEAMGMNRATLIQRLRDKGIGTQVHYLPLTRQPYYRTRYGEQALPGADSYYASILSLPLFAGMNEADVDNVVAALRAAMNR